MDLRTNSYYLSDGDTIWGEERSAALPDEKRKEPPKETEHPKETERSKEAERLKEAERSKEAEHSKEAARSRETARLGEPEKAPFKKRDTVTICFTNNKGGSGKSTSCANLGYELSAAGKKILLIDGDMQLNLSLSFFEEDQVFAMAEGEKNLYHAIRNKADLEEYIVPTIYENLDLIPSSTLMSQVEYELFTMMQREFILKKCLQTVKSSGRYDYILIDAPPTLGTWVINILCASDYVIVPVEASPWGLFGLANMFDFLNDIRDITDAQIMGVLITKVDERKNYYKQTREALARYSEIHVFHSVIHVDSAIEWAQDASKPVAVYKRSARSAAEFKKVTEEVIGYGSR